MKMKTITSLMFESLDEFLLGGMGEEQEQIMTHSRHGERK